MVRGSTMDPAELQLRYVFYNVEVALYHAVNSVLWLVLIALTWPVSEATNSTETKHHSPPGTNLESRKKRWSTAEVRQMVLKGVNWSTQEYKLWHRLLLHIDYTLKDTFQTKMRLRYQVTFWALLPLHVKDYLPCVKLGNGLFLGAPKEISRLNDVVSIGSAPGQPAI